MVALKRKVCRNRQKLTSMNELTVGSTYKNFTVLSQALGFPKPPEGNSRKAVMSALAEQYELSKDGRQITVVAKKEVACVSRRGNNTKYADLLHRVLWLYALTNKRGYSRQYTFFMTRRTLMYTLGMTSMRYYKLTGSQEERNEVLNASLCSEEIDCDTPTNDYLFEAETERTLRMILDSFLKSEKRHKYITYRERHRIETTDSKKRYADKTEEAFIEIASKETLKDMGVDSIAKLGAGAKRQQYYNRLSQRLYEKGILKCYKVLSITVNDLPETINGTEDSIDALKAENRAMIKEVLLEKIPKNYEKALKKAEEAYRKEVDSGKWIGGLPPKNIVFCPPENYIQEQTRKVEEYW